LITQITLIFPKWRELYRSADEINGIRNVWLQTMIEFGVNSHPLIEHGLKAARATGWVRPPAAGQFCQWCWDEAAISAGIPNEKNAIDLILTKIRIPRTRLTGAGYHIWSIMDQGEARRKNTQYVTEMIISARLKTIEHWKSGRPWNEFKPLRDSECLMHKPTEPNRAQRNIRSLMESL
jgi:hypothetical protein